MDTVDKTIQTRAQEMADIFAMEFQTTPVVVEGPKKMRKHWGAYYCQGRIVLGDREHSTWGYTPEELERTMIHEFAHHLTHEKGMAQRLAGGRRDMHGMKFFQNLVAIVKVWYTDPSRYTWGREYPRILQWAKRRGFYSV